MLLGFGAGGLADLEKSVAMGQGPFELAQNRVFAARLDEQPVLAMPEEVGAAGAGRAEHGHAAGHGFQDDESEAFRDRGQRDEVAALQVRGELGVGQAAADLDVDPG